MPDTCLYCEHLREAGATYYYCGISGQTLGYEPGVDEAAWADDDGWGCAAVDKCQEPERVGDAPDHQRGERWMPIRPEGIDGQEEDGMTDPQRRWIANVAETDRGVEVHGFTRANEGAPGFRRELELLLNSHGRENGSNTPDFILADYMRSCLEAFDAAVLSRDRWYGVAHRPGATAGATADTHTG